MADEYKRYLGINVLQAAQQRIAWAFDTFPRIYCSFSGGKDSTVMTHLVMEEAIRRGRKVGLMYIDFEAQYKHTIDHVQEMYDLYAPHIEPFWVALPIHLRNAVSMYQHHWICWNPDREADWIRQPSPTSITNQDHFPFYRYAMEFEEFVPEFGHWYARQGPSKESQLTACFVAIRTAESLNRWRTIAGHGTKWEGRNWTNYIGETLWNVYPIYDWTAKDIWRYHGKTGRPYNHIYDLMHKAGLSLHQQRLCQPYGDDQRKGLWLFHVLEPETWAKIVARVNGANSGALYAQESGNILGNLKITKPEEHTWESFAMLLLESLPPKVQEHYRNKIAVFIHWWRERGIEMEDDGPITKGHANWKRICKALLRNDYWCKGIGFSQTKSGAYSRYQKIMERRRREWGIFP
jgi:predicted phosphoadenosine phosphosulfate sulfurtransferase